MPALFLLNVQLVTFCFRRFYALSGVTSLYNFVRFWMVLSKFSDTFVTREVFVRCLIVVSKLQQEVHLKKRGHHQILKTDETFLVIFGTLSLLTSYFDGMRNPFSFSFIRNGTEFQS